jgi:hypothetical protein
MSVLRPSLSRRVGLALVAAALLLTGTLVAAPSVSGAPPARVKQFIASLSAGAGSSLTVTVTNCGGPTLPPECSAPSTIGLGAVQIAVPTGFQPATGVSAISNGTTWNASYNEATKTVDVIAPGGSNKLNPGQSLLITFNVTTTTTCEGAKEFTTKAWGANAIAGSDPFEIKSSQPTVACSGGIVNGPNGQTEQVSGNFDGAVIVTFGGVAPDCGGTEFGTLGDQWQVYHLPTPVTITPGPGFVPHGLFKVSTSEFPLSTAPGGPNADSSWYLTCYAVPKDAGHPRFVSRGTVDGFAVQQTVGDVLSWVGILASCVDAPTPCVSEQFLTTGPGAPPWTPSANKVHIATRMLPGDPHKS